jgi:hypothetical protein
LLRRHDQPGPAGVETSPWRDPQSHFGAGHQNTNAVLEEADRLGIPRLP